MTDIDLKRLSEHPGVTRSRVAVAEWIESPLIQRIITVAILLNAVILGMETSEAVMDRWGYLLAILDKLCLGLFILELSIKIWTYRLLFWRSGWNLFDFFVVGIALVPGAGPWAVLRSLRVLRILRLFTVVPAMRKVVAAFLHAIPGLTGVMAVMAIFFYTAAVLATNLFGDSHPQWFGSIGESLFSLFQIMTLESWSMGIVRPILEVHPWAWGFFVPFIIIATFTILNLFIGIIVSTMQELATLPQPNIPEQDLVQILERMESDIERIRQTILSREA